MADRNELPHPPPFRASDHHNDGRPHLLVASTGSVATIKLPLILKELSKYDNASIRIILSHSASQFLQSQSAEQPSVASLLDLPNVEAIYHDEDEWREPWVRGNSILHIELRRWADYMLIAPLSANSMAKLANGISDNLILSVCRAWDTTGLIDPVRPNLGHLRNNNGKKPIFVYPAMNTAMWQHPVTKKHIEALEEWGFGAGGWLKVCTPVEKELACGDTGAGAMRDWRDIVDEAERWSEPLYIPGERE
ncbi:hypothetical protein M8818_003438 [Zalaria obscura]|uniref:Uncharacterized protein n=1 Tax=Zalaria obscura TaxID=2024903 RepID=A0ACC3SEM0_9PEZI